MAEAMTENLGQMAHEEDNYLDFELGDEQNEPVGDMAGKVTAAGNEPNEAAADDFDFQFDELDEGGDQSNMDNSHGASGDAPHGELGVSQDNVAVSEIDYEDDEEEPTQAPTHPTESHGSVEHQNHDDDNDLGDNVDEITYDDTDLDVMQATATALESNPTLEADLDPSAAQQELHVPEPDQQEKTSDANAYGSVQDDGGYGDEGPSYEVSAVEEQGFDEKTSVGPSNDNHASGEDHDWSDGDQSHGVIATYKGREYELFASTNNSDPETYFFASTDEMDYPLSEMFHGIRSVLSDEVHPTDELILSIEDLDLEIRSSSDEKFLSETTMRDLLSLYLQLQENDGVTDEPTLFVQLIVRSPCEERFRLLSEAAGAGQGLSEFYDSPEQSDMASGHYSDGESVDGTASPEEQAGGADDDMEGMEPVGVVEEAFFFDDTNNTIDDDHTGEDVGLFDGDSKADNLSVHENETGQEDLHQGESVDEPNVEDYGQPDDHVEEAQADQGHGDDAEQNITTDHANTKGEANEATAYTTIDHPSEIYFAGAADPFHTGGNEISEGLEDFTGEVESGVAASDSFATGKAPLSVRPFAETTASTEREMMDEVDDDDDERCASFWKKLGHSQPLEASRVASVVHEEYDLIDYSDDDEVSGSAQPSPDSTKPEGSGKSAPDDDLIDYSDDDEMSDGLQDSSHDSAKCLGTGNHTPDEDLIDYSDDDDDSFIPSVSPSVRAATGPGVVVSAARVGLEVEAARGHGRHGETCQPAIGSMLSGSPTLSVAGHHAAPSSFASHSSRFHFNSSNSPKTTANLSDPQVQPDLGVQPETVTEPEIGSTAQSVVEEVANNTMLDEGGDVDYFLTNEDTADNGPATTNVLHQVISSKTTSNTSTLHGDEDEIDYDDDEPAADGLDLEIDAVTENPPHELDEIDWENDEEEAVPNNGEDTTNQTSPELSASAKRNRETDNGTGLVDENGTPAKRQKL